MTNIAPPTFSFTSGPSDPASESSVPARVARWIRSYILENQLQAGDPLPSQRDLSHKLGVSRPSVREGLSMLETLGLIRIEQRRGIFVAGADGGMPADFWPFKKGYDLREVYQFRVGFEPAALALAFPILVKRDLSALQAAVDALRAAAANGDTVAAAEQDTLFHDLIFQACPNRLYRDIRRHLAKVMQDSQWVPMVLVEPIGDTAREHGEILDAIRRGESARACQALANHIRSAARRCDIDL